jgi:hypothetical protein
MRYQLMMARHARGQQEFFFWPSVIHCGTDLPSALSFFSSFARTSGDNLVPQRGFRL